MFENNQIFSSVHTQVDLLRKGRVVVNLVAGEVKGRREVHDHASAWRRREWHQADVHLLCDVHANHMNLYIYQVNV